MHRHGCIRIEITRAFVHDSLDMFEVLRSVAGLNLGALRLVGFNFNAIRPKLYVTTQRFHDHSVTLGPFRMAGSCVMFLKDWMMNDSGGHRIEFARISFSNKFSGGRCPPFFSNNSEASYARAISFRSFKYSHSHLALARWLEGTQSTVSRFNGLA